MTASENERWLLPAGIEELLPAQAARLEWLRRSLIDLFFAWGYELVVPPLIEYLPSLLTGTGGDLDLQTFKITDQITGRQMGVRADITPQVARIDAHHLKRKAPARLCYLGTVLHTRPDGFSGARSFMQVGAELFGHSGIESDVEILCLLLETLAKTGIREVHLDLGHVGIFRGLARQAGLTWEQETQLFDTLQRKARPELYGLLHTMDVSEPIKSMIASLSELNGGEEVLEAAASSLDKADETVQVALHGLGQLAGHMHRWVPQIPLYFDLAELRGYRYHTGVVFAAFVPGHGQEIARGGRYDDIGKVFGRARPATGFSTDLRTLVALTADATQDSSREGGILAPFSHEPSLAERVTKLRESGERVIYALPGQEEIDPLSLGCDRLLVRVGERWEIQAVED